MTENERLIERFYTAFQQLDYKTMQDCYAEEAVFSDPAFGTLNGNEVRAMWEMLCKQAKAFSLSFSNIKALDEEYNTCNWIATYNFSKTGRKVINNITAHIRIQNGKITEHTDNFDLWKWSRQALGTPGLLLGWTPMIQNKIKNTARKNLERFINSSVKNN
ncbi:MAG: nuclear transport factor 2 family protein [Sphingobacteriales bacterium]|nr:nuclear transport factor 2 family protein [Sphingobacteriales bacterium]MBI3720750.1 nuclear transport factor 2 family protein [Sphingobacteriales bacterium]